MTRLFSTVQTIHIVEHAIVGILFETVVEIGLEIKDPNSFVRKIVIELANGQHGCLPTPELHRLGI